MRVKETKVDRKGRKEKRSELQEHKGKKLEHNVTAGVIISNQSLVLQKVTRDESGNYYCVATNIEGDGHSNPIVLRVKCKYESAGPECEGNSRTSL
ncbi:hypothetical protein E2C01_082710 [Portunus trituberculatus]|uniref:Immunoglobulin I-set domain-containing protein n=1 Tax=Portunus trituberculatus TaxID=210409 RepID=A0A5B7IQM8_PORTR|nr:hypothetical protein [Portunus trituberculatus]